MSKKVKFAVICASNQNRSMEAHSVLSRKNFNVQSYGTGQNVKLPGPTINQPNVYAFMTPYEQMYQELQEKDENFYTNNGILAMLDRNRRIKKAPQRWQDEKERVFEVVITCEERCFDAVCEDLMSRKEKKFRPVHVINIDIRDNHEDASIGGRLILTLCQMLEASKDLDAEIETILEEFLKKNPTPLLYAPCFY